MHLQTYGALHRSLDVQVITDNSVQAQFALPVWRAAQGEVRAMQNFIHTLLQIGNIKWGNP